MKLTFLVSILLISFCGVMAENPYLRCLYVSRQDSYTCHLTIFNPNGVNNFTEIEGNHYPGMTNNDVTRIITGVSSNTTNVPSFICKTFPHVTEIQLSGMGIQWIDADSFVSCQNLQILNLNRNKINKIEDHSFRNNTNLESVNLNVNQLNQLPENLLANLGSLSSLSLAFNNFSDFPDNLFKSLTNLTVLSLDGNRISNLKHSWFETLEILNILYVDNNEIEEFPSKIFTPLKNLDHFGANNNKLRVISSDSFGFHPLHEVALARNQIEAFDERLVNNTKMTNLNMENNICVDKNIFDYTTEKEIIRREMATCFMNFNNLPETTTTDRSTTLSTSTSQPGCVGGNLDERMCQMEAMIEDLQNQIRDLANRTCSC